MASPIILSPFDPALAARRLAEQFDDFSAAVDNYRLTLPLDTPPTVVSALKARAQELESQSHLFTADAIGATLAAIQNDLSHVKEVTRQAKDQLQVLQNISKAVAIAASAVNLGTAILAADPMGILHAAEALGAAAAG